MGGYVLAAGITMVNKDDMILELMDLLVSWDPDTFKHMFIYIIKILWAFRYTMHVIQYW